MSEFDVKDVSRETLQKLEAFAELVRKWNPKINLVSKSSLDDLWDRHILDSVQVFRLAEERGNWVDIGSGGGFPGIVIAILNQEEQRFRVRLVESDQRKCAFLRTAIRELGLTATVDNERIESAQNLEADILSARALSDLSQLLIYAEMHLKPSGVAIFPKGQNWQQEVEEAQHLWSYQFEAIESKTNSVAAVLMIKDITRA